MKRHLLAAVSAISLTLAAGAAMAATADQPGHVSPAPGTRNEAMSAVKDKTSEAVGVVSAEMTTTTKGFVTAAAGTDMYEVEAGKIAEQRGQSGAVKDFGAQMVKAHTATTKSLKSILASKNIAVTPPAHLDDRHQGLIDDLRGAKAADFDHRYMSQQEAIHKEASILMRGYAKDGDNAAIKMFASDTLPKVEDHLKMAQDIEVGQKTASQ